MYRLDVNTVIRGRSTLRGVILSAFDCRTSVQLGDLVQKGLKAGYSVDDTFREIALLETDKVIREVNDVFEMFDD